MSLDFEPFSERVRRDPYPHYRRLRDEAPVYWAKDAGMWVLSRYRDVRDVLKRPEQFSSDAMGTLLTGRPSEPADPSSVRVLILLDPPAHAAQRAVVNRGFTPRRIAALEGRLREIVDEAMLRVRGRSSFDLVSEVAIPLPVTMIAELLGVERERLDDFKRWSDAVIAGTTGSERGAGPSAVFLDAMTKLREYLGALIEVRRREPKDDLISTLADAQSGDASLTDDEVTLFAIILLIAGNETTTNLISNAVRALLAHPDELAKLQSDPTLVASAVEETLRYDSPIQFLFRRAREPVEIGGVQLPENAPMLLLVGSANRDERQWRAPDVFDVTRDTRGHLGFGFGVHFCLGASLARLEARVAVDALIGELPGLRPAAGPVDNVDSFMMRGPRRLVLEHRTPLSADATRPIADA